MNFIKHTKQRVKKSMDKEGINNHKKRRQESISAAAEQQAYGALALLILQKPGSLFDTDLVQP